MNKTAPTKFTLMPPERIEQTIYLLRGQKIIFDRELAKLYGVQTRVLNQAVRRNKERFPKDFMFALKREEIREVAKIIGERGLTRVPNIFAFTEQGVAMLSSVLHSPRAVQVNIEIMRAFVRFRQLLASNIELSRRMDELEQNYDEQFKVVFDAIRNLMRDGEKPRREIGFHAIPMVSKAKLKTPTKRKRISKS